MTDLAAVILAGGAGRRMGGVDKVALRVGGRSMLDRVLDACRDTSPRVVVGPARDVPSDVLVTTEDPPGGGPVAAIAAGLATLAAQAGQGGLAAQSGLAGQAGQAAQGGSAGLAVQDGPAGRAAWPPRVAVLAADLPLLTPAAINDAAATLDAAGVDGAVYVDADGRRQLLCGVWRLAPLRAALDRLGAGTAGASMRALVADLRVAELVWREPGPPPWYDCDTEDDLRQAERWAG